MCHFFPLSWLLLNILVCYGFYFLISFSPAFQVRSNEGDLDFLCSAFVNAAGCWSGMLMDTINVFLPVCPRKRYVYVIDCPRGPRDMPLFVDTTGLYCRPEGCGTLYLCGQSPSEVKLLSFMDCFIWKIEPKLLRWGFFILFCFCKLFGWMKKDAYSEPCQTSKMELFAKIVNGWKPLTVFTKRFLLYVWQCSEYTPDYFRNIGAMVHYLHSQTVNTI